jgi:hypothetical protein
MRRIILLLVGLLAVSTQARGDFSLTFDQTSYTVDVGGSVNVKVFLTETGTNLLTTEGLIGAGLQVKFNQPSSAIDPAQVVSINPNPSVNPNDPDFDFLSTSIIPASHGVAGSAELDWGLTINTFFPPTGQSSILIGTFTFVAGSLVGDVTNLESDLSGLKFILGNGIDIDDTNGISSTTASISTSSRAIPEPASVSLLALGIIGLFALLRPAVRELPFTERPHTIELAASKAPSPDYSCSR